MTSSPRHSYGITLHPSAYQPLLRVLDMDESTFRRRTAVDGPIGGNGRIDVDAVAHKDEVQSASFRANRESFERLLREGLDVRWEHALAEIQTKPDGVILNMQNGQKIVEKFVVGADGPHSNTRITLLPKVELKVLPVVAFNGKRRVKQRLFHEIYAPHMKDSNIVEARKNGALLHVSVNENAGDSVSVSWIYSRLSHGSSDPLHKPNRPVAGATDIPEKFYDEIGALKDLEQPFADIFDEEKLRDERVLHWLMRTVMIPLSELQALAKQDVIFLGDSVHAQPILGGWGANAAIKDAIELAEHIAKNGSKGVADWYEARYAMWSADVEKSEKMIMEMHQGQKCTL
ncbi:hypothetical protein W97_01280 [Coniosporium apollinis CBS 100218]|uniref:FAD-binding domain-containing protein n=1 Tax=Coniosporium apollinis (strain CBS 100218) TaxID=1168221 RepID=R7YKB8_CONA1|nr:uncharacterized protein W97_01280 [Coniosporium apollinis CBS 100218]EON62061.1 hypothetical protein W97_01280 [Coniosporium apollinis CBS 100218]